MFRRLQDRLTSAVYGASSGDEDKVRVLQAMGFDPATARRALESSNGDVDRAAELCLRSAPPIPVPNITSSYQDEALALRNAMEESLQSEEQRLYAQAQQASMHRPSTGNPTRQPPKVSPAEATTKHRSAAVARAGQAAANRSKGNRSPIHDHHPNVKVPTKLEDKTKEEQILRNVNRVQSHPAAVDTLLKALTALRNDPNNAKFRNIDRSNPGYQRSLANAPGAEALLLVMNFQQRGNKLVLDRQLIDPALLYLGISALEQVKEGDEYKQAKRLIAFEKEIEKIHLSVNSSEDEALKRAGFISKTPSEPGSGTGALMQVGFGNDTIKRRFDADDILQDVLNWLGGNGSVIPERLLSREWCLVDKNRFPVCPIDCQANLDKTLQYVGFWPSGLLEIRPSPQSWLDRTDNTQSTGSARGLGAAPKDILG